jgi:hypothetical protein
MSQNVGDRAALRVGCVGECRLPRLHGFNFFAAPFVKLALADDGGKSGRIDRQCLVERLALFEIVVRCSVSPRQINPEYRRVRVRDGRAAVKVDRPRGIPFVESQDTKRIQGAGVLWHDREDFCIERLGASRITVALGPRGLRQ